MTILVPAKKVVPASSARTAIPVLLLGLLLVVTAIESARAQTYTVIHSFGSGTDGANPGSGVLPYSSGRTPSGYNGTTENGDNTDTAPFSTFTLYWR
jgi:hypothetical protein